MLIYRILFVVAVTAVLTGCVIAAYTIGKRPLKPFARNFMIGLLLFEVFLAAMHLIMYYNTELPPFWRWFFDVQQEENLPTIFSAMQLLLIAVLSLLLAWRMNGLQAWQRLYFLLLLACFAFLSLDEFYQFHETLGTRVMSEAWRIPYGAAASLLFLGTVIAYLRGFRNEIRLFMLMFMGFIIMAISGIVVEEVVLQGFVEENRALEVLYIFEEIGEMVGATVIFSAFLSYAQENLADQNWRLARRALVGAASVYAVWLLFALLVQPGLEARLLANPLNIQLDNGNLELVGYRISRDHARPGDEIALTLYWLPHAPMPEDYSISLHALSQPDFDSVSQSDDLNVGTIPAQAWFPEIVRRRTYYLVLPKYHLVTPASYLIGVRVWYGPWPWGRPITDTTGLAVSDANGHGTVGHDMAVIASIPVLPAEAPPALASGDNYRFPGDNFALAGYQLPADPVDTYTLPIQFVWESQGKTAQNLTQFFHLYPADGGEVQAFDQRPFGGRYPTVDWVPNSRVVDEWKLSLPESLPPGTYDVYTGMYSLDTMQRSEIRDSAGNPVKDNAIHLGQIVYAPDEAAILAEQAPPDWSAQCFGVGVDLENGREIDILTALDRTTGEFTDVGVTGTYNVEGLTFSADGSTLYAVEEMENYGLFVTIDPETGKFAAIGGGLVGDDNPARNVALGEDDVKDIDSLALHPQTGEVWGVVQDQKNYLIQINPQTGEIVRDAFGTGNDYVRILLDELPGEHPFLNVEDIAIDPRDGTFYVIAGAHQEGGYESVLARLDFDTLDTVVGTIRAVDAKPFLTADGLELIDVEGLSFYRDGTLYAATSNNSNNADVYETLWQVDPQTGDSTRIAKFSLFVDYEAIACVSGGE